MIEVLKTPIADLLIIKPKVIGDHRGYFVESYNQKDFMAHGLGYTFVQDNQSYSKYGTLRGLHFQTGHAAQTKLIRVLEGKILDVAVDLRKNSKTFGQHFSIELSSENFHQLLVPGHFAHGFAVLSETATVAYKCDQFYDPKAESGIFYADPDLNIDWKLDRKDIILSEKDSKLPAFKDFKHE